MVQSVRVITQLQVQAGKAEEAIGLLKSGSTFIA
jgi:hypothetical protein